MDENNELSPEEIKEAQGFTGEIQLNFSGIPYLHFNGKPEAGTFGIVKGKGQNKTEEIIGKAIKVVILKVRYQFQLKMNAKTDFYSLEVDNTSGLVEILESGQRSKIDTLPYGLVREKYPDLKPNMVLYVLFRESLWKLRVSGTSFKNFYSFHKAEITATDTMLNWYVALQSKLENSQDGLPYHEIVFKKAEAYPKAREAMQALREINAVLIDTKPSAKMISDGGQTIQSEDLPEIQVEDYVPSDSNQEINIEDIPFSFLINWAKKPSN